MIGCQCLLQLVLKVEIAHETIQQEKASIFTAVFFGGFGAFPLSRANSQEIKNAVQEALQDYVEDIVQAEHIEGFLAGGLEWLWLFAILPGIKAAGLGFAGVLGKKAGDKLFDFFEKRLRQRNLQPKAAPSEATEDRSSHRTARGGKTAKNKRQKKSRKS